MKLPKKCGDMYIMFDDNNQPEYGFLCEQNYDTYSIKKFVNLKQDAPEFIVLPKLNEDTLYLDSKSEKEADIANFNFYDFPYITGLITIEPKAFKGVNDADIVIPFNTSVALDWNCFDDNSNITFLLPDSMNLKQIYRRFDTGYDYESEHWTLIADKKLNGSNYENRDSYSVSDYDNDNKYVNYSVNHERFKEYTERFGAELENDTCDFDDPSM